jgi:hypothetical protein
MSFGANPARPYVAWRPNQQFVNFFEQMKKRRIPSTEAPTMKVTNSSPPTGSGVKNSTSNELSGNRGKKAKNGRKVNYSSPSEVLVNTARAQTGYKRKRKMAPSRRRKASGKRATSRLESKIKKHKF